MIDIVLWHGYPHEVWGQRLFAFGIHLLTGSVTHCSLLLGPEYYGQPVLVEAMPHGVEVHNFAVRVDNMEKDGWRECVILKLKPEFLERIEARFGKNLVKTWLRNRIGLPYNLTGSVRLGLSKIFGKWLIQKTENGYFCSELCAEFVNDFVMDTENPGSYTPGDLIDLGIYTNYEVVKNGKGKIVKKLPIFREV